MNRRLFLSLIAGTVTLPHMVRGLPSAPPQPHRLNLNNPHTGESFSGIYRDDNGPIPRVMDELSVFLRDFHSGEKIDIDVGVIDFLSIQAEPRVLGKAIEQVVRHRSVVQCARRTDAVAPDYLVRFLPVDSFSHGSEYQSLRSHEGKLGSDSLRNLIGPHLKTTGDIFHQKQNPFSREKRFGYYEPSIRAVIERALEELNRVSLICIRLERENESRESRNSFGAHRISFVSHCR